MGFGWLKTVGQIALKVLPAGVERAAVRRLASPSCIPLVIKGATGLHTVPAVVKYLPIAHAWTAR